MTYVTARLLYLGRHFPVPHGISDSIRDSLKRTILFAGRGLVKETLIAFSRIYQRFKTDIPAQAGVDCLNHWLPRPSFPTRLYRLHPCRRRPLFPTRLPPRPGGHPSIGGELELPQRLVPDAAPLPRPGGRPSHRRGIGTTSAAYSRHRSTF